MCPVNQERPPTAVGLGSGSRDRVIVELGLEGRLGPGFCQVVGQAHMYSVLDRHGVAGRTNNRSHYFGTWVRVGSWGQQKSSGHVLAISNQYAVACLFCVHFVLCGCLHQRAVREGRWAACLVYGLIRTWLVQQNYPWKSAETSSVRTIITTLNS